MVSNSDWVSDRFYALGFLAESVFVVAALHRGLKARWG